MKQISFWEFEANFDHVVNACHEGETFIIRINEQKSVALVPVFEYNQYIEEISTESNDERN